MIRAAIAQAQVFESWQGIQEALKRAIAPLTDEQMSLRLVPGLRSVREIAEHIVFGRALWLHHVLGEGAAEVAPMLVWDKPDDPLRAAAQVLHGLDLTWRLITVSLMGRAATEDVSEEDVVLLRTIWGLIDHDLPHSGELSFLLGAYGLTGIEI